MDYKTYLKQELEKIVFIEIKRDIELKISNNVILHKGDYPVFTKDLVNLTENAEGMIQLEPIIDGMVYTIACDESFKNNDLYINFLKSVKDIKSYMIMQVEQNKKSSIKKAIIYATALNDIYPSEEGGMNRIYLLMDLFNKNKLDFIEREIVDSLKNMIDLYKDAVLPNFHLGEYYLDKDRDLAKYHLQKCLMDRRTSESAAELIERISNIENYDNAVEMVKKGMGAEALRILMPLCEDNPNNLDARYYTAVALRQTENYYKALTYLEELLSIGELPEIFTEIALNLACLHEFESAISYFNKALDIKPMDVDNICNTGVCYLNLGEMQSAKDAFERVLKIKPDDKIAKMWLEKLV